MLDAIELDGVAWAYEPDPPEIQIDKAAVAIKATRARAHLRRGYEHGRVVAQGGWGDRCVDNVLTIGVARCSYRRG